MTAKRLPTVEQAMRSALRDARDAGRMRPWHEPYAALAQKFARQATAKTTTPAELVRISTRLEALLAKLPLSDEGTPDDRPSAAGGGTGEDRARPVGLESAVGSGPEVGDTALPG